MHVILDRLMISTLSEANDPFFLDHYEVEAVLYFGDGGMFADTVKLYHRPIEGKELSEEELQDGITFLKESLSQGRRVLAVGKTGATIVTAYLTEMGFSMTQANEMLGKGANDPKPDQHCLDTHHDILMERASTRVHD